MPTEKEDLLDLIMAIHAQAFNIKEGLGKDNMFYLKYSECIEKAKVFHKDDPELSYYVKEFQKKDKINKIIIIAIIIAVIILYSQL